MTCLTLMLTLRPRGSRVALRQHGMIALSSSQLCQLRTVQGYVCSCRNACHAEQQHNISCCSLIDAVYLNGACTAAGSAQHSCRLVCQE